MNLPTTEECFKILEEYNVPQNIIEHSLIVNKISIFLAKELKTEDINIKLLDIIVVDVGMVANKAKVYNLIYI